MQTLGDARGLNYTIIAVKIAKRVSHPKLTTEKRLLLQKTKDSSTLGEVGRNCLIRSVKAKNNLIANIKNVGGCFTSCRKLRRGMLKKLAYTIITEALFSLNWLCNQ